MRVILERDGQEPEIIDHVRQFVLGCEIGTDVPGIHRTIYQSHLAEFNRGVELCAGMAGALLLDAVERGRGDPPE